MIMPVEIGMPFIQFQETVEVGRANKSGDNYSLSADLGVIHKLRGQDDIHTW